MKKLFFTGAAVAALMLVSACVSSSGGWNWFGFGESSLVDSDAMEVAEAYLEKMTLDEKLSLTHGNSTMTINAIPRVGIMEEFWMSDGPHTVRPDVKRESFGQIGGDHDYATSLPALSALAATWDPGLATRFGHVLGAEARDRGKDMMLGPGVNIMRTPLCGRNFEYMGEDPTLTSRMVVPLIQAMQSYDIAASVKHFAVNNQEWNRSGVNAVIDDRTLREIYLPAFEAAVKEGRVLTVMSGYNKVNGEFCSHNAALNNRLLKEEWEFPGFVVTDWGSLHDTLSGAFGGTDVEMNGGNAIRYFKKPLTDAVKSGRVPESLIDDKARRVLYVMAKIHKIDGEERKPGSRNTPEHQLAAREIAAQSMILLKNDNQVLPLEGDSLKRVLILGHNAIEKHCTGGWSAEGKPPYEITLLEGLKAALKADTEIVYYPYPVEATQVAPLPDSVILTEDTEVENAGMTIRAWKAAFFNNPTLSGDPGFSGFDRQPKIASAAQPPKPGINSHDFSARWVAEIKAPETGEYVFGMTIDDGARLFVNDKAVINVWKDGSRRPVQGTITLNAGETYTLRAEYYQKGGDAVFELGWRIPSERGGEFAELAREAGKADAVILMTGTRHGHGQALECEGADRPDMQLLPQDNRAIARLLSVNPKTVIVNLSGAPVEMPWISEAHTLLQMSYSGQEAGNALADVLLGKTTPSGKLPYTMPVKLLDSPAHALGDYNGKEVRHAEGVLVGYRWFDAKTIEPLFPFGHGLSYTTFEVKPLKIVRKGEKVQVAFSVTNTGTCEGAEVVQVYVGDREASVTRPPKELKAFQKVFLKPGETEKVKLTLNRRDFSFWDIETGDWKLEPGIFDVMLGTSSRTILHSTEIVW